MSDTTSRDGPSLLVVGFDGSAGSHRALAYAAGMARREMSDLVVVEINRSDADGASGIGFSLSPGAMQARRTGTLAKDVAWQLDELLPGRWWAEVGQGDAADELARISNELRSDAIVIGRSRGYFRRPLGCIADRLFRRVQQPVIVVP